MAQPPRRTSNPPPAAPAEGAQLPLLLSKWRESLDLHARYASLDAEHYWHVQPWPKHERPARWIIDLASQRVAALGRLVEQRRTEGDRAFLEALELMAFLAGLVGLQSVERYIPLASVENERRDVLSARTRALEEPTREMPRLSMPRGAEAKLSRTGEHKTRSSSGSTKKAIARAPEPKRAPEVRRAPESRRSPESMVVEDAIRLLGWGRAWHELPELIGRLAERPSATEIRRILREQRARIEKS